MASEYKRLLDEKRLKNRKRSNNYRPSGPEDAQDRGAAVGANNRAFINFDHLKRKPKQDDPAPVKPAATAAAAPSAALSPPKPAAPAKAAASPKPAKAAAKPTAAGRKTAPEPARKMDGSGPSTAELNAKAAADATEMARRFKEGKAARDKAKDQQNAAGRKAASGGSGPAAKSKKAPSFTQKDASGSSTGERWRSSRYSAMDRNK